MKPIYPLVGKNIRQSHSQETLNRDYPLVSMVSNQAYKKYLNNHNHNNDPEGIRYVIFHQNGLNSDLQQFRDTNSERSDHESKEILKSQLTIFYADIITSMMNH